MSELFTVLPPGDAFAVFGRGCSRIERTEIVPLEAALGRVLAEDLVARETLPSFARSTMDGYAVRSADTAGASEQSPAYLRLVDDVPTGVVPAIPVGPREAARTHTGAMIPPGADAVVMVEDTNLHPATGSGQAEVEVLDAAAPGENVLTVGEDVRAGSVAMPPSSNRRCARPSTGRTPWCCRRGRRCPCAISRRRSWRGSVRRASWCTGSRSSPASRRCSRSATAHPSSGCRAIPRARSWSR